jgi:predicted small lipoprotein YifL
LNNARFLVSFCVLGILLAILVCGKKGPPSLPKKEASARVTDLKAEREKEDILLRGMISGPKELEGARVYYAQYRHEESPCEGCPIEYQGYHGFGAEVVTEEGFLCRVPVKVQGHVYFFRVNLVGADGAIGPPSDTIKVVVE